ASPGEALAAPTRGFEAGPPPRLALPFYGDTAVPDARFDTYKRTFGDRFEAIEIDPADARDDPRMRPHSVLTIHLKDDDPEGPTKRAEQRVIQFFKERTGA